MLDKQLEAFGFSKQQTAILIAVLEQGPISAKAVARTTALPASTAYLELRKFLAQGILRRTEQRGAVFYSFGDPRAFLGLVERSQAELQQRVGIARTIADLLSHAAQGSAQIPKIRFVSGKREVEHFLYERLPVWRKSLYAGVEYTWWGYQDEEFIPLYRRWLEHVWSTTGSDEQVRLFSNEKYFREEPKRKIPGRIIRPVPAGFSLGSTLWLNGAYLIMVTSRSKQHYALEVCDETFSENLKAIFKLAWFYSESFSSKDLEKQDKSRGSGV